MIKNNFVNDHWNAFNILTQNASRVGAIDLGLYQLNGEDNFPILNKLNKNKFKALYLLGADELEFKKKDEFIIYQGTHGDRGAEMADVILPGCTYTEKDGCFVNLEGRVQRAFKASYPPGEAKEDWEILNILSTLLGKSLNIKNRNELEKKLFNFNSIFSKNDEIIKARMDKSEIQEVSFIETNIEIDFIDYYFTNHIARSSLTMNECRTAKNKTKLIETEG